MDNAVVIRLETHISNFPEQFARLLQEERLAKPAPGKWSKQEILGHLIDSAINNLKRFTEAQFLPAPYTVIRYNQDALVAVNQYQQLSPEHLLQLWENLNRHIVFVIKNIPPGTLRFPVIIPSGEEKTLEWLIRDYVDHMEHHLKQIF